MKLLPKTAAAEKEVAALKDTEKNKDMDVTDMYNKTKKLNNLDKEAEASAIGMPDLPAQDQNEANRNLRHLILYERRMDKGLFCALALIIVLCLVGMATSIGGALYLKFRSSQNQKNHTTSRHTFANVGTLKGLQISTTTVRSDHNEDIDTFQPTKIHIRLNISIPDMENGLLGLPDINSASATADPFEDVIWDEFKRRNGFSSEQQLPFLKDGQSRVGKFEANDIFKDADEKPNSSVPVNKHRVLQQPPTFGELLTFIRKALRIPTIKIVRDHQD